MYDRKDSKIVHINNELFFFKKNTPLKKKNDS